MHENESAFTVSQFSYYSYYTNPKNVYIAFSCI